ncbi:MAG: aminopeptidase P family protein [Clostridia bacterium]|nr:aminopeptidase P family protein [Clostridia bacterium]
MCEERKQAELIITPAARRYLSGFSASDGYLVLFGNKKYFFTDGRYFEEATRRLSGVEVHLLKNTRLQLLELFEGLGVNTVSVETEITVEQLERLRELFPTLQIQPNQKLSDSIRDMRAIKSEDELEQIKKAQRIAERAFENILDFIRVGVSEKQIAAELDYAMRKAGAERSAFDTIVVSGKRGALPHGEPSYKTIAPGEFVTMDFGAVVNGYHSDMTRTVAVGGASEAMEAVYQAVVAAQKKALAAASPNTALSVVDDAARKEIKQAGFGEYFTHSTGHGVGLEIHEGPNLSPRAQGTLKTGNVVTVEPGIYIPGKFGVRIEDMVYVTETGCENLTKSDKSLIIL